MCWIQNLKVGFTNASFLVSSLSPPCSCKFCVCERPRYNKYSFFPVSPQHHSCGLVELRVNNPKSPMSCHFYGWTWKLGIHLAPKILLILPFPFSLLNAMGLLRISFSLHSTFYFSSDPWVEACSSTVHNHFISTNINFWKLIF